MSNIELSDEEEVAPLKVKLFIEKGKQKKKVIKSTKAKKLFANIYLEKSHIFLNQYSLLIISLEFVHRLGKFQIVLMILKTVIFQGS